MPIRISIDISGEDCLPQKHILADWLKKNLEMWGFQVVNHTSHVYGKIDHVSDRMQVMQSEGVAVDISVFDQRT